MVSVFQGHSAVLKKRVDILNLQHLNPIQSVSEPSEVSGGRAAPARLAGWGLLREFHSDFGVFKIWVFDSDNEVSKCLNGLLTPAFLHDGEKRLHFLSEVLFWLVFGFLEFLVFGDFWAFWSCFGAFGPF